MLAVKVLHLKIEAVFLVETLFYDIHLKIIRPESKILNGNNSNTIEG